MHLQYDRSSLCCAVFLLVCLLVCMLACWWLVYLRLLTLLLDGMDNALVSLCAFGMQGVSVMPPILLS
jgi:hypothetical protein